MTNQFKTLMSWAWESSLKFKAFAQSALSIFPYKELESFMIDGGH